MDKFKKYLPSVSFLVMILCFLLPFFVVKCNGQEIMNIKGYNYLGIGNPSVNKTDNSFLGIEAKDYKEENAEVKEKTNVKYNIFANILFLILLSGVIIGISKALQKDIFKGKNDENSFNKIFFGLSLASLLFIIVFILDLKFDSKNQIPKEMEKVISVNLGSGLNFLILISILNIIFYGYELKFFDKLKTENKKLEEKK